MGVTEDNTDLRWSGTLLCELADLVDNLLGSGLQPCWSASGVWEGTGRDTLSVTVHTTHDGGVRSEFDVSLVVVWCCWRNFSRSIEFDFVKLGRSRQIQRGLA